MALTGALGVTICVRLSVYLSVRPLQSCNNQSFKLKSHACLNTVENNNTHVPVEGHGVYLVWKSGAGLPGSDKPNIPHDLTGT